MMKLNDIPVVQANAREFAKMYNRAAQRSPELAMELMQSGIRGNVTAGNLIRITKDIAQTDIFDKQTQKLTNEGIKEVIKGLKRLFRLESDDAAKNITIGQVIKQAGNYKHQKIYIEA